VAVVGGQGQAMGARAGTGGGGGAMRRGQVGTRGNVVCVIPERRGTKGRGQVGVA